jgi:hypothetical protein
VHAIRQLPYGVGQQIPHAAVTWDVDTIGLTYRDVVQALREGTPPIAVQFINASIYDGGRFSASEIRIHPHTLRGGEEVVVAERVRELLGG